MEATMKTDRAALSIVHKPLTVHPVGDYACVIDSGYTHVQGCVALLVADEGGITMLRSGVIVWRITGAQALNDAYERLGCSLGVF
jgi:hypothetical protein